MKTENKNHIESNPLENESPLAIARRLFPLTDENLRHWQRVDALSLQEVLLLFYGVIPERILNCPLGEVIDDVHQEFLSYLQIHFPKNEYTRPIPHFIRSLDEDNLEDLLKRGFSEIDIFDFYPRERNLSTSKVVRWMRSKNLPFPIQDPENLGKTSPESEENLKQTILTFDVKRLRPEQQGKLLCRIVASSLWKVEKKHTLPKIQKDPLFKEAVSLAKKIMNKTEPIEPTTIDDWIRDLNPNYNPKK